MRSPTLLTLILAAALVACGGRTPGEADGGLDAWSAPADGGNDAGASCEGTAEGAYICSPSMQCCGGVWRSFVDGPCFPHDAGAAGVDAGPPDCTGDPVRAGCACTDGTPDQCVAFSDSLRCVGGTWTTLSGISCCVAL